MANSLRWTEADYADFERRKNAALKDVSEQVAKLAPIPRQESKLERRLWQQIIDAGLPTPQRNYFFLTDRDLELDFAWPQIKVAVEVQGSGHRIKENFHRDIEKRALAMLAGWRVLEVSGATIKDGRAMAWLKQLRG
mgnify:FL=1